MRAQRNKKRVECARMDCNNLVASYFVQQFPVLITNKRSVSHHFLTFIYFGNISFFSGVLNRFKRCLQFSCLIVCYALVRSTLSFSHYCAYDYYHSVPQYLVSIVSWHLATILVFWHLLAQVWICLFSNFSAFSSF